MGEGGVWKRSWGAMELLPTGSLAGHVTAHRSQGELWSCLPNFTLKVTP